MTIFARILALPIRAYQLVVSPLWPAQCRYQPTCSAYGLQALRAHGALKGSLLTLKRMASCHPWGGQGMDPVPKPASHINAAKQDVWHCQEPAKAASTCEGQ